MNKFKEREEQINVQLERMGAPFRVETWSKWRNGVQNYVYHLNAPKYKTTLIVYSEWENSNGIKNRGFDKRVKSIW